MEMNFKWIRSLGALVACGLLAFQTVNAAEVLSDGVMMKNGRLVLLHAGEMNEVLQATTLADGTLILPDGSVTLPDGKRIMLSEGQNVSLSGRLNSRPGVPERAPNKQ